ncbi:ABC transporter substrate-binding protein [Conexibacter sp. CPCC 206217]|uniref:ABC transporter substrate-binding protein n=1 Tax=Conexibacter sp. CPCC 206217 TaxID=3064574 RepID=UPI002727BD35|nr:ABC transporter substrate-binding protein [Conexibacter sp. CPCC 206217]MDO8212009.1 ABC transporter substrate-binding protein [Conexibacter sp. CPCC 206217]
MASTMRVLAVSSAVAVLVLVLAACGSSTSDSGTSTSGASGGGGDTTVAADPKLLVPFPKHPAPAGGNGGATDTGVTESQVQAGSLYAASGPLPGAQVNTYLGARAYFEYVNASGGVYGRKVALKSLDTGFDASKGQAICTSNVPDLFAFVGTQSNVDAACKPLVESSGIPFIGNWFDPSYAELPNAMGSLPSQPPGEMWNVGCAAMKAAKPEIKKVAILWINVAGIKTFVELEKECWRSVGVEPVYDVGIDAQAPNMTSYVLQAKSKGADVVDAFAQDVTGASRIAQAMKQQSWDAVGFNYAVYDEKWHKLAAPGAAGWTSNPPYGIGPFLDRAELNTTPGGALFYKWFPQVNPGKPIDVFAIEGWVQAQYFTQGLIDAGPKLTRRGLLAALARIDTWDNGGLTAPVKWNRPGKAAGNCGVVMQATDDGYERLEPKERGRFFCDSKLVRLP